ncbi:hypothetical protein DPMN_036983 [Dreissena polymorpha]|uniref:Uncharacterized protein n=1 Tax=Dreissena polymorpha TaxID=45954 RepID=A0A9D4MEI7_DREPO|nr:hypothetical protein DPMN_036983 [Dreissena polymorpha]
MTSRMQSRYSSRPTSDRWTPSLRKKPGVSESTGTDTNSNFANFAACRRPQRLMHFLFRSIHRSDSPAPHKIQSR